jgi:hypothetical protein
MVVAWKGDDITDVGHASEVAQKSVETKSEATVRGTAPATQVEIPGQLLALVGTLAGNF